MLRCHSGVAHIPVELSNHAGALFAASMLATMIGVRARARPVEVIWRPPIGSIAVRHFLLRRLSSVEFQLGSHECPLGAETNNLVASEAMPQLILTCRFQQRCDAQAAL